MSVFTRSGLSRSNGPHASFGRRRAAHHLLVPSLLLGGCILDLIPARAADPPALSVAVIGGGPEDTRQAGLFAPFSKQSGAHVQVQGWDGALATLQGQAQTRGDKAGNGGWDLVSMEEAPLRVACRQGLFLSKPSTVDPAETAPDSSGRDCGVRAWRMNLVLAWDKSRVDMAPSWSDFWDVARRPGKRGLRRDPRGTLEIALMADGVAPDEVYRTLATGEGVDRAFRKLDQLKPYIVWWSTPAEAVQIIDGGAVLMTSAPNDEVVAANRAGHRNFETQWAQSLGISVDWGVPRATTPGRRALAQRLLAFLADPGHQPAPQPPDPDLSPPRTMTAKPPPGPQPSGTPLPAVARGNPSDGGQRRAALMMDDGFWVDHLVALRQRLDNWIELK